ncbi:tRNA 2-thiouridine(34) synthase MnmA [Candidatus Peregrinibacteria bacterium CG10_big_fil_rev_8_21_14_0_10_36_19]|nr:MAG: tRNA 2-thiouridine(34) synthase MnmA [Candidatus Peregrinibacteria bacterium CG10_big_fil_rev_8_21_14_0_10_36_19]
MKIALLASGGVDSSVALRLLKEQGHDVTAFYLKIWLEDELQHLSDCPWEEDLSYVRQICDELQIPLEVVPMQKEYFETVVAYTIKEVKEGRTPNPDVMCNSHVKFGLFVDKIDSSFDKIATGHYAQIHEEDGIYYLKQAPDPIKDQTYFLSRLSQSQLSRIIFPIGHLSKDEVRELAEKYNLPNKNRKDSQGICFLGKFKYSDFLSHYLGKMEGDMLEFETGKKLATHDGFYYYTIGQRKGIHLPDGPWFVVKKDTKQNIVYVSKSYHDEDKKRDTVNLTDFNWFSGHPPQEKTLKVKLRHGENFHNATFTELTKDRATIVLDTDDQGIAPGQFAVFYNQDICLGSAMII